jgi:hypothetical protein
MTQHGASNESMMRMDEIRVTSWDDILPVAQPVWQTPVISLGTTQI